MVGLGCEVFQIDRMKDEYGLVEGDHFQTMTIQATGGTKKTVEEGVERIKAMLPVAARAKRETRPASEIVLALQCGGSDGYSGITANPALGAAVDLLVKHGGTGVLAETPEIYGAEHLLTRRAVNRAVGEKLVERIRWWEDYTKRNGGEMNNNPSPGNKAGGLTTILEKSLGAAAKGGTTTLRAVYEYAEPVKEKGFVFMDTPGYDPVGATGQVAGGCNVMCFTTGRGSAFGCKPTPSIKLATNTDMYRRMADDMDINCGDIARRRLDRGEGRGDFRQGPAGRLGHAHQIGRPRLWRSRIRALANRRGDVRPPPPRRKETKPNIKVASAGGGFERAWSIVFARAGWNVALLRRNACRGRAGAGRGKSGAGRTQGIRPCRRRQRRRRARARFGIA